MHQPSVGRAAIIVAFAALLEVLLGPYLKLGWVSPNFMVLGIVFAVVDLRDLQAVLLGFFCGILFDALGGGLFGVGSLGGLVAATLALRAEATRSKGSERFVTAQVVAAAAGIYDLINYFGISLSGLETPSFGGYLIGGVVPDVLLNGVLAYLIGGLLLRTGRRKRRSWEKKR